MKITNLDDFKNRINILDVISHYIPLRKNGSNYVACCPFHDEKSASFMLSVPKNLYHCFGCNVSGDAIKFVMEYRKLDFIESLKEISDIINYPLVMQEKGYDDTKRFYAINEAFLKHCKARKEVIVEYCLKRGLSKEIIESFSLGFSGENFEINKSLEDKKSAFELGLMKETNNGNKSMFAKRLMIPIYDNRERIVGFSGRALEKAQEPKYINSKESRIYKKKYLLYGFTQAKDSILAKKQVYIVEGYFDVLSLHSSGITNAVGICGTALTKEHIALLLRYEARIYLALDNDKAGLEATKRTILLLLECECYHSFVLDFQSQYKDCNDILLYEKEKLFTPKEIPIIEYYIKYLIYPKFHDKTKSLEERNMIVKECKEFLEKIKSEYLRLEYSKFASEVFAFHIQSPKTNTIKNMPYRYGYDLIEAKILKSAYRDSMKTNALLEYTDISDFKSCAEAYQAVLQGNENTQLANILFDNRIGEYKDYESYAKDLLGIIKKHSKEKVEKIMQSNLSMEEKIRRIRALQMM